MPNTDLADVVLKSLALLGAAVAFVAGLFQYIRAQKWKRSEWVAQEMRQFFTDDTVRRALLMIDWGERDITFPPDAPNCDGQSIRVTDATVAAALKHHSERPEGFLPHETAIRDTFDRFLDGLERFSSFRAAKLVNREDLRPYLAYWIYHIRSAEGASDQAHRLVQLRSYIDQYSFRGVQRLFEDYRDDPLVPEVKADWWTYRGQTG